MELINQHTKKIMEECKEHARDAGLKFSDNTLEYIVTNKDLIELSPKYFIPAMYDYWMHDLRILQGEGAYKLYPHNPLETVINTRPAISFYNDNNPNWMNTAIFYHVLAHIDFFQNNNYFRHTWNKDFLGQALSGKRIISRLRNEHGRWVDYVIEFSRSIDNLSGYYDELKETDDTQKKEISKIDYYFDIFLQDVKKISVGNFSKELERYNQTSKKTEKDTEIFFFKVKEKYPEFESFFERHKKEKTKKSKDLMQFIMDNSTFINQEENKWMKQVMQIVKETALFLAPQIRTKIFNEGWASYWHEKLFMSDKRMEGHEIDFAKFHAKITTLQRIGINPYAIGLRLLYHLEEAGDKGKNSWGFQKIENLEERKNFDKKENKGGNFLFKLRENMNDFLLINNFVDQEFVDKNRLLLVGKRIEFSQNSELVVQYYIKSKKAEDYKKALLDSLYHPPKITFEKNENILCLKHHFEGKPLIRDYVENTMRGIEYLWGDRVELETYIFEEEEFKKVLCSIKDKEFLMEDI